MPDRRGHGRDFLAQLESFPGRSRHFERTHGAIFRDREVERGLFGTIEFGMPLGADQRLRSEQLDAEVMLHRGNAVRNHRVRAVRIGEERGEVIVGVEIARPRRLHGIAVGEDRRGLAATVEIPRREIEEMDRLFENPVADALGVQRQPSAPWR